VERYRGDCPGRIAWIANFDTASAMPLFPWLAARLGRVDGLNQK